MNSLRLTVALNQASKSSLSKNAPSSSYALRYISLNHSKVQINEPKTPLVISAVGKHRDNMVNDMTKYVREVNGSIRGSPGIRLGNHFHSLTMLADVPKNKVPDLMDSLKLSTHPRSDIHATVYEASLSMNDDFDSSAERPPQKQVVGYSVKITLDGYGVDNNLRAMHKVTSLLRRNCLDLAEMIACSDGDSDGKVMSMVGIAHAYEPLAKGFNPRKIMRELEALGNTVNCKIAMTEDSSHRAGDEEDFNNVPLAT